MRTTMTRTFTVFVLIGGLAIATQAAAACPAAETYKFDGDGVTTSTLSTGAPLPTVPFAVAGAFRTSNGLSTATGCKTTATATGDTAVTVYIGATGIPKASMGGYDGIACEDETSWVLAEIGVVGPVGAQSTIFLATVTTTASTPVPGSTTPASVCSSLVGSVANIKGFLDSTERTFRGIETHRVACGSMNVPCTSRLDVYGDEIELDGEAVSVAND